MSRITIVFDNGLAKQDGVGCEGVDLSSAPSGIHALQWYGDKGEIEFANLADGTKPQNEFITELPEWVNACLANIPIRQAQLIAENEQKLQELINSQNK